MTEIKPVKAWAVVGPDGSYDPEDLYADQAWAMACARRWPDARVIPVTIVPGHEQGEDTPHEG